MITRWLTALLVAAPVGAGLPACATRLPAPLTAQTTTSTAPATSGAAAAIDRLLDSPALAGATIAIHVESLADGRVIYSRNADTRMIPASVLKIITAAVAAERLGWSHRFETRLEATGTVTNGVLDGDLVVFGSGDPTINAQDLRTAPLFDTWAAALRAAGISRVAGRLLGDDRAFADEPLGAGWAWDYATATYAAPSGALSYNENLVAVRATPGPRPGAPATVTLAPAGHGLVVRNEVVTAEVGATVAMTLNRAPGADTLVVSGQVPAGGAGWVGATTVADPTRFFVEALRLALAGHGIEVVGGAARLADLVETGTTAEGSRRVMARHESLPLSSIVAQMLKVSQNFYAEMLIKAIGRTATEASGVGSTALGRQVIQRTLQEWDLPIDRLVVYDGSGLSRYNYANVALLTAVLHRMWHEAAHRGPFVAALPVAGHDGTLAARMTDALRRRVQAKTGTIANVRSLAGYAETIEGERLVFAMIANHFVAPSADIDRIMEQVLGVIIGEVREVR